MTDPSAATPLYSVILEVRPAPGSPEIATVGGAFAVCVVATADAAEAEQRARALLEQSGWEIKGVDEHFAVTRERFLGDEAGLARCDVALAEGIGYTLHTWPARASKSASKSASKKK